MKKFFVFLAFTSLLLLTACGAGNGNGSNGFGGSGGTTSQNFSASSLNGSYTYQIVGTNAGGSFTESAVFAADGKGNIGNGTEDVVPGPATGSFTGSYTLSSDGTGFVQLSSGEQFAITLVSASKFYMSEVDGNANASGTAEQQTATALTTAPSGTFVFKIHTGGALIQSNPSTVAQVGALTVSTGAVTGNEDVLTTGGSIASLSVTGTFNAPVSAGRGTGTLNDTNGTLTFQYYIIDGNHINIMPAALNAVSIFGYGRAELQSGGPFTLASLTSNFAFGSKGDTLNSGTGGSQTVGRFTAGGDGTISAGAEDFVLDGTSGSNDSFTGTYTMASSGRAAVTLTSSTLGTIPAIFWMVSPSRAFFLQDSATKVEDGTIDAQSTGSFSASDLTGQSAFFMDGFNSSAFIDRVGTLQWDTGGNVTLTEFITSSGQATNAQLPGTYTVSANGRVVASVSTLSNNLVLYLTSDSSGYVLQNDGGTEVGGIASQQNP
ncbi:MAG TPA: hypothetical protein VGF44_04480 [Terriglobales bacterium]|jgi:hypothetical protein